jgi:putative salt-induced outer membrane protein
MPQVESTTEEAQTMQAIRRSVIGLVMAVGLAMAGKAAAQTAAAPPPPPAREGSAEFALVATSGNTSTRTIGLAGDITFRSSKWAYVTRAGYVQNQVQGVLAARSFLTTFRASREVSKTTSLFGQMAYLHDRFSGIENRAVVEGGVSGKWEKGRQSFSADVAAGYANEQRTIGGDLSTGVGGAGFKYVVKLSENSDFTDEFRYTQSFSTGDDYRLNQLAALTAKVNTLFSLKISNLIRYVNAPVTGFKTTDSTTAMALVAKF